MKERIKKKRNYFYLPRAVIPFEDNPCSFALRWSWDKRPQGKCKATTDHHPLCKRFKNL